MNALTIARALSVCGPGCATAVNEFNFGVIQVQPTGNGAEISAVLAHEGNSLVFGLDAKDLI